jgi:hypothetical protein
MSVVDEYMADEDSRIVIAAVVSKLLCWQCVAHLLFTAIAVVDVAACTVKQLRGYLSLHRYCYTLFAVVVVQLSSMSV